MAVNTLNHWIKSTLTLAILATGLVGCASTSSKRSDKDGLNILVDVNKPDSAFWLGFSLMMTDCNKHYQTYSFGEFYCAFTVATATAENNKDDQSPYTVALGKIKAANFLPEYAYRFYHRPNWFKEPGLRLTEFDQWMQTQLPGHQRSQKSVEVKGNKMPSLTYAVASVRSPNRSATAATF